MEAVNIGIEESKKLEEAKLTSAAAFVEGGIQDACDDSCSICLDEFCESEPSTVTLCKHEFHLQCILEWCQRSSQCPMCWQSISLKDPASQELFEAVVEERNLRLNPPRNTAIFHHPALGDFEIQHLPAGINEAELEERIIQQLTAAAAMGRARQFARRGRSSAQGRPQFVVFSGRPDSQASSLSNTNGEEVDSTSISSVIGGEASQNISSPNHSSQRDAVSSSGFSPLSYGPHASPTSSGRSTNQSSPSEDRAGSSDLQSFSEALKSRLNTISTRYKESISKSTRGWKERWFSRNSPTSDIDLEVKRETNARIATVSRMMEHMDIPNNDPVRTSLQSSPAREPGTRHGIDSVTSLEENHLSNSRALAPQSTGSVLDQA